MPPVERASTVPYPTIPKGEATCDGKRCLSDRETAGVISGLADALDHANARLLWLREWIGAATKPAANK